jgi:hypothetical protein
MHDDIHVNIDCMCNIDTIHGICNIYNMDKIVCTYHIYDKDKRDWRDNVYNINNIYDKDKRDWRDNIYTFPWRISWTTRTTYTARHGP